MSTATFFIQDCPTCGRRLQIRLQYLGREMQCQHCQAQFTAREMPRHALPQDSAVMQRVNALLENG